jgi:two-component system sensor histidine kinase YesM
MNGVAHKSVLTRLFILFPLVLLPTFVMSIVMYKWGTEGVVEKINTSSYSQMKGFMVRLEEEVSRMTAIELEFVNDRDLIQMATIPEFLPWTEQYYAYLRLQHQSRLLKDSSAYVQDVAIYLPKAGKVISSNNEISSIDESIRTELTYRKPGLALNSAIRIRGDKLYVDLDMMPSDFSEQDTLLYKIRIQFNKSALENDLPSAGEDEINLLVLSDGEADITLGKIDLEASAANEMLALAAKLAEGRQGQDNGIDEEARFSRDDYSVMHVASGLLNVTMVKFVRKGQYLDSLRKYNVWLWTFFGVSCLAVSLILISTYKIMYHPLHKLLSAFKRVEGRNLNIQITHATNDEFGFIYRSFNNMVGELKVLIEEVYEQKILTQRAQMKQLQSQIHPHFLYNNFQILHRMAKLEDYESLADLSIKLAQYYQYVTRNKKDEVPLATEVEFARKYVDIQSVRFQNRLFVEFEDVPPGCGHLIVPRLILQPVLENAFEHGLKDKASDGRLWIHFELSDSNLMMDIEDNGEMLTGEDIAKIRSSLLHHSAHQEITGLLNIHRRIQLMYGPDCGLQADRGQSGGLRIRFRFPREVRGDVQAIDRG